MPLPSSAFPPRAAGLSFVQFLVLNRRAIALLGSGLILVLAAETMLLQGYWLGLLQGLLVGSFLGLVGLGFVVASGATFRPLRSWGADETTEALRAAKRRGHILGWVDRIHINGGVIDHLVVTHRGMVVLNSTWHNHGIAQATAQRDVTTALETARRAEVALRLINRPAPVRPVVVIWGGDQRLVDAGWTHDGVDFIVGRDLKKWLISQRHGEVRIDRSDAHTTIAELKKYRRQERRSLG